MEIEHFSHAHPLILRDGTTKNDEKDKCSVCKQPISGQPSYGCRVGECKEEFVIHKSCAELPQQIQNHHFHPLHPLILSPPKTPNKTSKTPPKTTPKTTPDDDDFFNDDNFSDDDSSSGTSSSRCKGCGKYCSGFVYRCAAGCEFDLDVGCASLVPTFSYEGHHDHPLTLFNKFHRNFFEDKKCNHCDTQCDEDVFRCVACDFSIHKHCAEFPKQIQQHPFHPLHILSLSPKPTSKSSWWQFWTSDYCDACGKSCSGSVYTCEACAFNLHLGCSKLVPNISYEHHGHLLTHFDDKSDSERSCYCCGKDGKTSFCRCVQCDFNVHKSCTELPREIRHPFHRLHPLTLGDCPNQEQCDFCHRLDIHHLALKPNKAFVCGDCNFVLQIPCFVSLPLNIDHKCHVCPMTLTDSFVEEDNDDSDEHYCDACETQRDPKRPVYFCTECEFVAHINCVIPTEVLSLPTFKQKIKNTAEEAENKLSSTLEDFTSNRAFEGGRFQVGDVANPVIAKLDEDITKLCADIEAMVEKLKNLKSKRVELLEQVKAAPKEIS